MVVYRRFKFMKLNLDILIAKDINKAHIHVHCSSKYLNGKLHVIVGRYPACVPRTIVD